MLVEKPLAATIAGCNRVIAAAEANGRILALSVIDTALWDILGKVANLPLYWLLGQTTTRQNYAIALLSRPALA